MHHTPDSWFLIRLLRLPQVNGYPSSPFPTSGYVFVNQFQPLSLKNNTLLTTKQEAPCRSVSICGLVSSVHSCCNFFPSPDFGRLALSTRC